MKNLDFSNSSLYISARSPFARRVRLALLENQIPYQEKVFDVFKPTAELIAVNPLARVPAIQLKSGDVMIDSNLILQLFYKHQNVLLSPKSLEDELKITYWAALSTGLCEKTVEYFIDSLRPEGQRDIELKMELDVISRRLFQVLESHLKQGNKTRLVGSDLTQADLDMASALTYYVFRVSGDWKKEFPLTQFYLESLEQRDAFQKTAPKP